MDKAQLPRIFQANIVRLYERVVRPGLALLPVHSELALVAEPTLDEFLDQAAAQVDNYTGNEAAKAYALVIAAVFERQLSTWAQAIVENGGASPIGREARYKALLKLCATYADIDLADLNIGSDLVELLLVANVVRHGEGSSCQHLRKMAPQLWDCRSFAYIDIVAGPLRVSELMRIQANDLKRYVRAVGRFWGRADPLPMAALEVPV